jgi:succinate dehydrogenase / fumarate reductase iron-sulfur subunit
MRGWFPPLIVNIGSAAFIIYATVRAFWGSSYWVKDYQYPTPFHSPCIGASCAPSASHLRVWLGRFAAWIPLGKLVLPFLLVFRITCYHYREADYRSVQQSIPPAAKSPSRAPTLAKPDFRRSSFLEQPATNWPGIQDGEAQMSYNASIRVWRGDQDGDALRDFTVEVNQGEVVLDVIHRLQQTQTPELAVRWNCKAGKCGSCSAEINGHPKLMCMTRMSTFAENEVVTVTPMRTFPVIRDLVTDVSFNYEKTREIPSFAPPRGLQPGEYRMAQVDIQRSQEFRKCIECFLCQNVCHVIRDHEDNKKAYAGPRFFIRIAELEMHPLDTADRRDLAQDHEGLGLCNITKCCTEVCPENIKITDNAIIPMKERVAGRRYDPAVWLGNKLFRR